MRDQFAFTDLIEEMEAAEHAKIDAHRTKAQAWFDALILDQQNDLARRSTVANKEQRGNREKRKPKKQKPKPTPELSSFSAATTKSAVGRKT